MCGRFLLLSEVRDLMNYYSIENQTLDKYESGFLSV